MNITAPLYDLLCSKQIQLNLVQLSRKISNNEAYKLNWKATDMHSSTGVHIENLVHALV